MTYNVLYYGDTPPCQGNHSTYHSYLKTIVSYTKPDLLGLEKMAAIPLYAGDHSGTAPIGFADSILQFALNSAFPSTYAYCTYTNTSGADNMSVLFYNKNKLGFHSITSNYSNITDFNTYKLYYKDTSLSTTHDTLFLYVTLNHTQSGTGSSTEAIRETQISGEMAQIATHFAHLPNMLNMGDFNTHHSIEACYQQLVAPSDTNFQFYDPPFYPDAHATYPADWDSNPSLYSNFLTTSTRLSSSIPNSCGTSGGAKSWYDHIFISSSILKNTNHIYYIPNSYRTIGNDGNRVGISINDLPTNSSEPSSVIDALFQMSNKYPVMIDLLINSTKVDVKKQNIEIAGFSISNPVYNEKLLLNIPQEYLHKDIRLECYDYLGRILFQSNFISNKTKMYFPITIAKGNYIMKLSSEGNPVLNTIITIK